jgi:aminoglycoside 6'-N-acetyltransferase
MRWGRRPCVLSANGTDGGAAAYGALSFARGCPSVIEMRAVGLRPMTAADLDIVRAWLTQPHVAKWYLSRSTLDDEIADLQKCVAGVEPTHALVVMDNGSDIGWCQWYRCADYPDHAEAVGAEPNDVGLDYALGDPTRVGRGLGTALIGALVAHIRQRHPDAGLVADPEAANLVSRRVLEKNGFVLLGERVVATERTDAPMAIYRLPPSPV